MKDIDKKDSKKTTEDTLNECKNSKRTSNGKKSNKRNNWKGNKGSNGKVNDTSYYYTDPNVLASVTNFSFTEFLGVPAKQGEFLTLPTDTKPNYLEEEVCNIVTIYINPSLEPTAAEGGVGAEAINVVGMRNYNALTAGNGKTSAYAPQDTTIATASIGSAVEMYSHIKRAFNCYLLVNQRNRSYPKALFRAMGIDYDDFKANIANYRDQFNLLVASFDKIPMFNSITYLEKARHKFEFIYVDEDSPLAQTYLFVPWSLWTLDEEYNPEGSGLVTTYVGNTIRTMAELLDIFESMINALSTSSTMNYVYSDILRLIQNGKGQSFILETIPMMPDPNFAPVINDEIRHWINNAVVMGAPVAKDALPAALTTGCSNENDVFCDADTNSIVYRPTFDLLADADSNIVKQTVKNLQVWWHNNFINFDSMSPSIEDKVAATRLAVRGNVLDYLDGSTRRAVLQNASLGDMYVVSIRFSPYTEDNPLGVAISKNYFLSGSLTGATLTSFFKVADYQTKLKYAPRLSVIRNDQYSEDSNQNVALLGDLTYYTLLPYEVTSRMRDAEMFGLFDYRMS